MIVLLSRRRLLKSLAVVAAGLIAVETGGWAMVQPRPDMRADLAAMVREHDLSGATLLVGRDGRLLVAASVGDIGPERQLSVASASKWMTAALVMTVVDEGKLSLDTTFAEVFPEAEGSPAGGATLRQLLSFTAGQGGLLGSPDLRPDPSTPLQQSALEIAARPLRDPPGTTFRYGGPSLQLAGAMAERASGQRWADLFDARLARPLGFQHSRWSANPRGGDDQPPASVINPNLQAGLVTTASDYLLFLEMIAGEGRFRGRQILSPAAIDMMATVQSEHARAPIAPADSGVGQLAYGLGSWCERTDGARRCLVVSSPGAWGAYPWVDRDTGLYGLVFVDSRLPRVRSAILDLRRTAREAARTR